MARRWLPSLLLVALVWVAAGVSGCARPDQSATVPENVELRASGAGAALSLFELLAQEYGSDRVRFVYPEGLHSGGGIQGVASGDLDIGLVSRELTSQEASLGLEYTKLSDDGFVIAVHPSVDLTGVTSQQVRDIYAGVHDNWKELGGPDLGIVILDRGEGESGKMAMRRYFLGSDLQVTASAVVLMTASDMEKALSSTQGAIGYGSLGDYVSGGAPIRILAIDGVEPSPEAIADGSYTMTRPIGVVTAPSPPAEIADFLKWARSDEALAFAEGKGFAPPRNE